MKPKQKFLERAWSLGLLRAALPSLFIFSFLSCTQQSTGPKASGAKDVPQIYVLLEQGKSWWGFPGKSLQDSLGVRVVDLSITNNSQAEETLRTWNARPSQMLILGPGVPQKTYLSLSLPKVSGRKVLFLGSQETTNDSSSYAVDIDQKHITSFLKDYCSSLCEKSCGSYGEKTEAFGEYSNARCKIGLGLSRMENPDPKSSLLISIDWESLITHFLRNIPALDATQRQINLNFSNAFIVSAPGLSVTPQQLSKLLDFQKKHALENL